MPKVDHIQTSFAGGEFGPSLFGRTDIVQYANACEIVENFIPRPYGSIISTPGTRYVATVSDSTLKTRLIKFIFNRTDAYVIEMGDKYMRFFTDRGQVVDSAGTEDLSSLTASTVAFYKLNDNTNSTVVLDTSGNHNGVATVNTATMSTTGKIGACFNFAEKYAIEVNNHNDFSFDDRTAGTNPFSIAGWIYVKSSTGTNQTILSKWGDTREWIFYINLSSQLVFGTRDEVNGADAAIKSNNALSTGWHFVAATYDGRGGASASNGFNLYVDNKLLTEVIRIAQAGYVGMTAGTIKVGIGHYYAGVAPYYFFKDKIDAVALFSKELTQAEITGLYTSIVYQLTTVYSELEIFDVQFTQLNDVIWLTHKNHPPQKLTRTDAASWMIADFAFKGGPFKDDNTDTSITITPSATTGTINITVTPTTTSLFTVSSSTLGHHNAYWMIGGLAQTNATTLLQEIGYVQITHVINGYTATATVIKNLKAITATNVWAEGAWSAVRGYPARVTFHERRLFMARTAHEPQKVWGSRVFLYDELNLDTAADDDGLNLALASNESNEIQWLASTKSLIAGTYGGPFIINSGSTEPITPANANASGEVNVGTEDVTPRKIGNFLYYVQRFGKKLRELFYFWDLDTYKASDKTILSPHILGDGVVDMDYQQNPDTILYCVRTDGTLVTLTREVDQEVTAWARQTTSGTYSSIAIIPSQSADYDEAWVIVERWIGGAQKKYIEYFENIEVPTRQDLCLYLHSALTYNAYTSSSTSNCTISLSATGGSVTLTTSTAYFVAGDVGQRIRAIDAAGATLGTGEITAHISGTSVTLSITTLFTTTSYIAGRWGLSVSTVSGLDHLEAKTVGILADGQTESLTRTVATGVVTLGSDYFVLNVGLSYNQIIYTLPRETGSARGTAQGKIQKINEIAFKVNRSHQGFSVGGSSGTLDIVSQIITPSVTTLYTGILANIPFRGDYERGAQIYIKNSDPLPVEILSIMSTLMTADK